MALAGIFTLVFSWCDQACSQWTNIYASLNYLKIVKGKKTRIGEQVKKIKDCFHFQLYYWESCCAEPVRSWEKSTAELCSGELEELERGASYLHVFPGCASNVFVSWSCHRSVCIRIYRSLSLLEILIWLLLYTVSTCILRFWLVKFHELLSSDVLKIV